MSIQRFSTAASNRHRGLNIATSVKPLGWLNDDMFMVEGAPFELRAHAIAEDPLTEKMGAVLVWPGITSCAGEKVELMILPTYTLVLS